MPQTPDDSTDLNERKKLLSTRILPDILDLSRFLGKMNYGEHFYRKPSYQPNWEFEDRRTTTVFKPTIFGEVADPTHGTRLGAKGHANDSVRTLQLLPKLLQYLFQNLPIVDGSKTKNVVALQRVTGSDVKAERAFLNQTAPLNKIQQIIEEEDRENNRVSAPAIQNHFTDHTYISIQSMLV